MATSSSLDKRRDDLRRMNFWLDEYRRTQAYHHLESKMYQGSYVHWSVGVGPTASFTRAISSIAPEAISEKGGPYDHVIKVQLKEPTEEEAPGSRSLGIEYQLALVVAKELGLLEEADDELRYCTYGMEDDIEWLESHARDTIPPRISKHLSSKKYLLVVDNLYKPIKLEAFSRVLGLLPPRWTSSEWFISTTSRDACDKSKSEDDTVVSINEDDEVVVLITTALHQSAKHIFNMIQQESEEYWHRIALGCFHSAMMLFASHSHAATSNELIHQWAAQGILPQISINEEQTGGSSSKCGYMHQVGRVILEAFQEYSLLQLPFSPANESDEATKTAAHYLAYYGLVADVITVDQLSDEKELQCKKWVSFVGDKGWHVSQEWLSPRETSGPTSLIIRGCSHHSLLFSKLDHFLPKLCFLRVLDLSHSPLKSLPSSIGSLLNLRLLSLRGCHDLRTLFSSSTTSTTDSETNSIFYSPLSTIHQLEILDMNGVPFSHLTQDMGNQKSNLIYLDMSYSEVTTFPESFFGDMSNLEELFLVNCSNLVELPLSMASLSILMTLEITGTQITSFPYEIFVGMHNLQTLKLIDNKKLISLRGSNYGGRHFIKLHNEVRQSCMVEEIILEGHPTLRSFVLIGAPHIRRMSLHRCRKLESVEFKDLGALEELDLSATAIKELFSDILNLPQLRQLLLMDVPSLRRFPWHKLQRLPNVFRLDHCAEGHGNYSDKVAQVCISDSRLFSSFKDSTRDLVRDGQLLQSFCVQVGPCPENIRRLRDEESTLHGKLEEFVEMQSTYVDAYRRYKVEEVAIASQMTTPLRQTERHVEISGMRRYPDGLCSLLQVTRSISVTCDTSISLLSSLSFFDELEECELRGCPTMGCVFSSGLKNLRNVLVCNLKGLVWFSRASTTRPFSALEHLHLEDCPRLEYVVYIHAALPCLKTLDILFCYNLKTIFYGSGEQGGFCQLPRLQRIRLQELPQLKKFRDDDATIIAPMWKEVHVRGCWSLRCLPRFEDQPKKVKVNGERSWWDNLQWDSQLRWDSYEPELPPEFASFDEHAKMTSYLR